MVSFQTSQDPYFLSFNCLFVLECLNGRGVKGGEDHLYVVVVVVVVFDKGSIVSTIHVVNTYFWTQPD